MTEQSTTVTGIPAAGYPPPQSNNQNGYSTSGAAYPYAAQPPMSTTYYNTNPYYTQPYSNRRATLLPRIFFIIIAAFIIAGTISLIIWLILRPKLPDFRVDSFSVTNFSISSSPSLISGYWNVRLNVRNPNKKLTLSYDHVEAYVFYKSEPISDTTLPPFNQGKLDQTNVSATVAASSAYVEKWVADGIDWERERGSVNFNVRVLARVEFKAGFWWRKQPIVTVSCGNLNVGLISNRSSGDLTSGAGSVCKVGL
ncbi:NDR1/HIN1-like protein 1 [Impatiens glandulifera]|uniref:NDR1/HIN1-like protein 1 n=1 Tax=Impatiens glandulifera TaxID=253017 RepID=UPI001FB0C241|nr:NDR1/HIN1-like protein 1 [Impatiens glandulifera]